MATPLGISRERVRQMITWDISHGPQYREAPVSSLPVPELPRVISTQEVVEIKKLPEDILKVLKDLQEKSALVCSYSKKYRAEAEEYASLLNNLITKQGYSAYGLAKQIGVNPGGINSKLVRYGYKQSLGKCKSFRKIIYSNRHESASGHLMTARLEDK